MPKSRLSRKIIDFFFKKPTRLELSKETTERAFRRARKKGPSVSMQKAENELVRINEIEGVIDGVVTDAKPSELRSDKIHKLIRRALTRHLVSASELRQLDYSAEEALQFGFTEGELIAAKYPPAEVNQALITLKMKP